MVCAIKYQSWNLVLFWEIILSKTKSSNSCQDIIYRQSSQDPSKAFYLELTMSSEVGPSVIPFNDLEPQFRVPSATEPEFIRWLISWVGGPTGWVNCNPGIAAQSDNVVVGLMTVPPGNRQKGLHYHTITEIYLVIKGELESFDHTPHTHRAGPMDLLYIPPGVPHGVRNSGTEDLELIWIHDKLERGGAATYYLDGVVTQSHPGKVELIKHADLEPSWGLPAAKQPGFMRFVVNWVGGGEGFINYNVARAVKSENVAIGLMCIPAGNKEVPTTRPSAEAYVVVRGKVLAELSHGKQELKRLDAIYLPPGDFKGVRNHGDEDAYIVWVHEVPQKIGSVTYHTT